MTDHVKLDIQAKVEFHPYRTKRVFGAFIDLPRDSDIARELEDLLIKASGRDYGDNHCCYTVHPNHPEKPGAHPLHVWATDSMLRIGTRIEDDGY